MRKGQAIDPRQGIAATTFYDQIKMFFTDSASVLPGQGDSKGAERFARAGTHWMRHSHASQAVASGMPIEIAQQNLGHASLATATVYATTEQRRRMKAVADSPVRRVQLDRWNQPGQRWKHQPDHGQREADAHHERGRAVCPHPEVQVRLGERLPRLGG